MGGKFRFNLALLTMTLAMSCWLSISAIAQTEKTPEELSCSSYEAVYKPHPKQQDYDQYEMTIQEIKQEEGYEFTSYDKITVIKYNEDNKPLYELTLTYVCGGGSAPACSVGVPVTSGKPISFVPEALNRDFSPAYFIGRADDTSAAAPYSLVFPGSISKFYYQGRHISEEGVKFYGKTKPLIDSFPSVWLLNQCKN